MERDPQEAKKAEDRVNNWVSFGKMLKKMGVKSPKLPALLSPKRRQRRKRASKGFSQSGNFRTVNLNGKRYQLTLNQALVVEQYFKAWQRNAPEASQTEMLEKADVKSARLRDVFKKDPKMFKALFHPGKRRGTYRLNVR